MEWMVPSLLIWAERLLREKCSLCILVVLLGGHASSLASAPRYYGTMVHGTWYMVHSTVPSLACTIVFCKYLRICTKVSSH